MNTLLKSLAMGFALASASFAIPASAGSLNDETIYAIFDQANMADIATGRLGWKKSQNPEIRNLAKMVITDHGAVQQMGRDVAIKLNILGTPPDSDPSWAAQAATLEKLNALSGKAFDEAYLRHEIAYHTAVIDAIKTLLLPSIENEAFKALVVSVLPGFEQHLAMTKTTADKLGVSY